MKCRRFEAPRVSLPILALLLALAGTLTLAYMLNEDLWWHLTSGEAILAEGGIPDHDPFLHTSTEKIAFDAHSWLWSALLALLVRAGGLTAVMIFGALVVGAIIVLMFGWVRLDRCGLLNGLAVLLFLVVAGQRLSLRSQLATLLMLLIFLYLLEGQGRFTGRKAITLIAFEWLCGPIPTPVFLWGWSWSRPTASAAGFRNVLPSGATAGTPTPTRATPGAATPWPADLPADRPGGSRRSCSGSLSPCPPFCRGGSTC